MQQVLQHYRSGKLAVTDVAAPSLKAGHILVRTLYSCISAGTERSTVSIAKKSLIGKAAARPDLVKKVVSQVRTDGLGQTLQLVAGRLDTEAALGYSISGQVEAVGSGVHGLKVGDYVACAGQDFASHAECVLIPKNLCVKVPGDVELDDASYVAIGAIALQGVRQLAPQLGETVVVIGLGMIGLLTVQLLDAAGCRVIASDVGNHRRELAMRMGAQAYVDAMDAAQAQQYFDCADGVLITASTPDDGPVSRAADYCRKRGRVVAVGAVGLNIPRDVYYFKELDLRLSTSYGPGRYDPAYESAGRDYPMAYVRWTEQRNMAAFLEMIADQRISLEDITTHIFDIDKAELAYQMIIQGQEDFIGVLLNYPERSGILNTTCLRHNSLPAARPQTSSSADIQLGIIGAGNHFKDRLLPQITEKQSCRIAAICSASGHKARSLADKLGADYSSTDYLEIIEDPDIDAVLIAATHDLHAKLVRKALYQGKHVFVEKPLCITPQQLEQLYSSLEALDALPVIMVGHNRRYSEHVQKVRETFSAQGPLVFNYRIAAGRIPADHWVHNPDVGGGRIVGELCHFIDLLCYLSDSLPVSVMSTSLTPGRDAGSLSQPLQDVAVSLEFADGSIANLLYTSQGSAQLEKERLEILCGQRTAVIDDYKKTRIWQADRQETIVTRSRDKGFNGEWRAFLDAVNGRPAAVPDFHHYYRVMATVFAVLDSAVSRKTIYLREPAR